MDPLWQRPALHLCQVQQGQGTAGKAVILQKTVFSSQQLASAACKGTAVASLRPIQSTP